MRYSEDHYEKVAYWWRKTGGVTALIQDHYPHVSIRTVQRWVKRARELGLLV